MKVKIKYFDGAEKIEKIKVGDWIDLKANENVKVGYMESALIRLGVAMELPKGYEAHIVPRSSTFKKWGVIQTNHMGIIDNSYSGNDDEWMMPVFSFRNGGSYIEKGDRICQFRIVKNQESIEFEEVEFLENPNRNGFGSTGK